MRYQNWDILLFPEGSKVPVQEFKTQCHVTRDLGVSPLPSRYVSLTAKIESPILNNSSLTGIFKAADSKNLTQLPVLTSFVPSLMHNEPFRVSIHSWEKPKPSTLIENLVEAGTSIVFEARLYVDGLLLT